MTTRSAMIAEMADDMERSDPAAFASKINAAIRHYQPRRFWFNESRATTFPTVASTDVYTFDDIGTEFYRIDGAFITIAADDVRELERANYATFETSDTGTGEPLLYAYIARAIRLWRNPDDAYSVRLVGHIKFNAPATDNETGNVWMTEAYDLIMCRAKAELYAHRYEDPQNAAIMQQAEASALKRLRAATDGKTEAGYLEATDF